MKITSFHVGQRFFQADLFRYGQDIDNSAGDQWTTREEAEADGEVMRAGYDPEFTKRNPDAVEFCVREYAVDSVEDDGAMGSARTVD